MTIAEQEDVQALIALAKSEDLGDGDISADLLADRDEQGEFRLVAREAGVFAGREIAGAVLAAYHDDIALEWTDAGVDGSAVSERDPSLAVLRGPVGPVLSAERVLLNFLQRLSAIATLTRRYVDAVAGTSAAIFDTRKTTPGWRTLEKYAVRCGGGRNHRFGLYDAVLIKDNHLAGIAPARLASAVFDMLNALSQAPRRPSFVEVEVDTLEQLEALLAVVGIDVILLDNFSPARLRDAVAMRDAFGLAGKVALEASGGVDLDSVRAIAETGVERISVGAITHSAAALDLSLERC